MKFYDHVNHVTAIGHSAMCYENIFSVETEYDMHFTVFVSKRHTYNIYYDPNMRTVVVCHPKADHIDASATILEAVILFLTGKYVCLEEDE